MYIKQLTLQNYRCYPCLNLNFENMHIAITGANGSGKSTILEAIRFLSVGRSFRKSNSFDIIAHGTGIGLVSCTYHFQDDKDHVITCSFTKSKKTFSIDDEILPSLSSLVGKLPTVHFEPQHAFLFKEIPDVRRKMIDETLSLISETYLYDLKRYKTLLKTRNSTIVMQKDDDVINLLKNQLIEKSFSIVKQRREFLHNISFEANKIYQTLNGTEKDTLKITYRTMMPNTNDKIDFTAQANRLFQENRSKEAIKKTTVVGPHRDDFSTTLNDFDISTSGSQGENRLAALSLKLAFSEIIGKSLGEKPILLLDDVTSDLDTKRIQNLIEYLKTSKQQVFISILNSLQLLDGYRVIDTTTMGDRL